MSEIFKNLPLFFLIAIIIAGINLYLKKDFIQSIIKHLSAVSEGIILYYNGEKKKGREYVAHGLAQDFGLNTAARQWLVDTCEESKTKCEDCPFWTCPGKGENNR